MIGWRAIRNLVHSNEARSPAPRERPEKIRRASTPDYAERKRARGTRDVRPGLVEANQVGRALALAFGLVVVSLAIVVAALLLLRSWFAPMF